MSCVYSSKRTGCRQLGGGNGARHKKGSTMNAWLRWLAGALTLGVFFHHQAGEVEKTLQPHVPRYAYGIWSPAPDDHHLLEHDEMIRLPAIPPPSPEPLNQNGQHHNAALVAGWSAERNARIRAANADFHQIIAARRVVLRSPDDVSRPA